MTEPASTEQLCVLVVAPRFPAINQPWIDTYLEQLERQGIDFRIATTNRKPLQYNAKVDELRLLDKTMLYESSAISQLRVVVRRFFKSPKAVLGSVAFAWHGSRCIFKAWLRRVTVTLKRAYFILWSEKYVHFDVIHSHSEMAAYELMHLSEIREIPLALTFHGLPPSGIAQLSRAKRQLLYTKLKLVFVNTCFARNQLQKLGCPEEKILILPQGLPLAGFPFQRRHWEPGALLRLLTVGRFHHDKGHRYALLACARLASEGIKFNYVMVGVGPERARIESLIKRLGLESMVDICEGLSGEQLLACYMRSHLFILPSVTSRDGSHEETQGVVLQEAQATGCIPIATRTGGIPECIHHGVDGLLVRDRSSKDIASAVKYLLGNLDIWESMQNNGRKNVETLFSADSIGQKMAIILRHIAAGNPAIWTGINDEPKVVVDEGCSN